MNAFSWQPTHKPDRAPGIEPNSQLRRGFFLNRRAADRLADSGRRSLRVSVPVRERDQRIRQTGQAGAEEF